MIHSRSSAWRGCAWCLVASNVLACSAQDDERLTSTASEVVGGTEADVDAWPTAVSVQINGAHGCGGTLVASDVVLTAEHCVDGRTASSLTVIAGRHDLTTSVGTTRAVTEFVVHATADVALLKLASPIAGIAPSRLVAYARMAEIPAGSTATTVGWGRIAWQGVLSDTLRQVDVDVIGVGADCEAATNYSTVEEDEICVGVLAGGRDSCQGDSGGPVFVRRDGEYFVLGVTSGGVGCAQPGYPGIYAFLPKVHAWVHANMAGEPAPSLLPSAQIMTALG